MKMKQKILVDKIDEEVDEKVVIITE